MQAFSCSAPRASTTTHPSIARSCRASSLSCRSVSAHPPARDAEADRRSLGWLRRRASKTSIHSNMSMYRQKTTRRKHMALVKWDFDHAPSSVDFTVRHILVSKARGRFTKWSGKLELDEQDMTRSRVDVDIAVASVDTYEPQRDAHLRSADFFEAEKHPRVT